MKKYIAIIAAALLILSLAGCADSGVDNDIMTSPAPTAMPSASPYVSPDMSDGEVKDKDGIIEDKDTGDRNDDKDGGIGAVISPSPTAKTDGSTNSISSTANSK